MLKKVNRKLRKGFENIYLVDKLFSGCLENIASVGVTFKKYYVKYSK